MVIILCLKIISVNILFHAKITKKRKRLSNSSIKIDYDFLSVNKDQSDGCWVIMITCVGCWVLGVEYWVIMFTYVCSLSVWGVLYRRLTLSLQISGGPEKKLYQLADSFYCVIHNFNFPVTPIIYS